MCHSSVYTTVAGSEGQWHPSVMNRSRGASGQEGQAGCATSSGSLPYVLLMALEEGHLGVGLYSGSLSSRHLKASLPTFIFHSHSDVGCHELTRRKNNIVGTMPLFPYLVTNRHQLRVTRPGNKLGCTKGTVLRSHQSYTITLLVHAP